MLKRIVPSLFIAMMGASQLLAAPFVVDPAESTFRVDVKATGHSFEVAVDTYQADIVLDESDHPTKADFSFNVKSLVSDNGKRDKKMLKWLESDTYQQISFSLTEVKEDSRGKVGYGTLTMHGVSKPVEVPFSISEKEGKVVLSGSAMVDYENFGLEVITMFFMKVKPELNISFELVGEQG